MLLGLLKAAIVDTFVLSPSVMNHGIPVTGNVSSTSIRSMLIQTDVFGSIGQDQPIRNYFGICLDLQSIRCSTMESLLNMGNATLTQENV